MGGMKTESDGRILYRLRFDGRPDLDSDHLSSVKTYARGDLLADPGSWEHGAWRVREIEDGGDGEPDTLLLEAA
jgi:hypothetical protein